MCGIWAVFGLNKEVIHYLGKSFSKIRHRGPDALRIECSGMIEVRLLKIYGN